MEYIMTQLIWDCLKRNIGKNKKTLLFKSVKFQMVPRKGFEPSTARV